MKKLFFLIIIFFTLGVLFANFTNESQAGLVQTTPGNDHRCLQIKVTFNADKQWSQDGTNTIEVACSGQGDIAANKQKYNPPGCNGGKAVLSPQESVTLGRCSCFVNPKDPTTKNNKGCLVVGKKVHLDPEDKSGKGVWTYKRNATVVEPIKAGPSCNVVYINKDTNKKVSSINFFCGTNESRFKAGININCKAIPTTPPPTGVCVPPGPVQNIKITCPNCNLVPTPTFTITPTETPVPPTPTFTITPTETPVPPTPTFTITPTPTPGGNI